VSWSERRWEALLFNKEYRREVVIAFKNGKGRIINQEAYNTTLLDEGGV
jgi:hypothetical protein